ncbi:MAG: helix-turn-helix transcriptional regulator, partial [Anaeromyxobacteraceae bacterium]
PDAAVAKAAVPAPILLEKEVPPRPPRPELPDVEAAVWTGEALRMVREGRGLSIRELCDRTKITRYHLENIEADRFSALPAPVYLRGILVAVARELRLDGQKVSRSYLERMCAGGSDPVKPR